MKKKEYIWVIAAGVFIGGAAVLLSHLGNPGNMGFCIACFLRDIAGALGLHNADKVQYMRPEIFGLILGAFLMALLRKEFRPRGGSSPIIRFFIGAFVMTGALVFLGCPLRMVLRIGGGDLNAIIGLVGFAAGILIGVLFLKKGFTLKRAYSQSKLEGALFPAITVILLIVAAVVPTLFKSSAEGPGSMRAPLYIALIIGVIAGALAQRSRLCLAGGIRDSVMFKDFKLLIGFGAILVTSIILNLCLGTFKPGFADQSVAHTDWIWNLLGMLLVGWGSVLLGGCPLRQLILAGEGSSDSAITVIGMIFGAAICHIFGLASSGAGATSGGMIMTGVGIVFLAIVSVTGMNRKGN